MIQMHLFLHKSEARAALRIGALGAGEIDALNANRPFSYAVVCGDNFVGSWGNAILHPVLPMPTSDGAPEAASDD